jgi:AcrR family transcriptional regulator
VNAYDRLIEVALELFVGRGYNGVGTREIVERADVTKPTLYHHFGNKLGVMRAIADRIDRMLFDTLGGATEYRHDMPANLEQLVGALLEFARTRPAETRLLLSAQIGPAGSESRDVLLAVWNKLSERVERFFGDAAGDHGNMAGRAREYAVSFLGVVSAYIVLILDRGTEDGPAAEARGPLAYRVMHQFSHGIYS